MPSNIKLVGVSKSCKIFDTSSWGAVLFKDSLHLSEGVTGSLKSFGFIDSLHGEWRIKSVIKRKLWVFVKANMNLYFTEFCFDESGILNVESIAAQRLRPPTRKCRKCLFNYKNTYN